MSHQWFRLYLLHRIRSTWTCLTIFPSRSEHANDHVTTCGITSDFPEQNDWKMRSPTFASFFLLRLKRASYMEERDKDKETEKKPKREKISWTVLFLDSVSLTSRGSNGPGSFIRTGCWLGARDRWEKSILISAGNIRLLAPLAFRSWQCSVRVWGGGLKNSRITAAVFIIRLRHKRI